MIDEAEELNLIILYNVFEMARYYVRSNEGVESKIVSPDWKELADMFEKYEQELGASFQTRIDNVNDVLFVCDCKQESIRFIGNENLYGFRVDDLLVLLPSIHPKFDRKIAPEGEMPQ